MKEFWISYLGYSIDLLYHVVLSVGLFRLELINESLCLRFRNVLANVAVKYFHIFGHLGYVEQRPFIKSKLIVTGLVCSQSFESNDWEIIILVHLL